MAHKDEDEPKDIGFYEGLVLDWITQNLSTLVVAGVALIVILALVMTH